MEGRTRLAPVSTASGFRLGVLSEFTTLRDGALNARSNPHPEYDQLSVLGNDLLPWMVVALGGAMLVGNVMALVKPPPKAKPGELAQAPRRRTLFMAGIGLLAVIWAGASIFAK